MKIKIHKNSLSDNHILYMNDKKYDYVIADQKKTEYSIEEFKFLVYDMIYDWETEMVDPKVTDGVEYSIVIKNDNEEKTFRFKNKFPKDIYRLDSLIEDVLEEVING